MILSLLLAQAVAITPVLPEPAQDLCPNIPAQTADGCPDFPVRTSQNKHTGIVKIIVASDFPAHFQIFEQTQIRAGDIFKAVIRDDLTREIFSESPEIEVIP